MLSETDALGVAHRYVGPGPSGRGACVCGWKPATRPTSPEFAVDSHIVWACELDPEALAAQLVPRGEG